MNAIRSEKTDAVIAGYIRVWNEQDADRRLELLEDLWSEEGTYTDPLAECVGRASFSDTVGAVQAQFPPDFVFTLGPLDAHHNIARFTWELGPAGAEPLVVGFDVAVLDDNGRIKAVHGFLDKVPTGA